MLHEFLLAQTKKGEAENEFQLAQTNFWPPKNRIGEGKMFD